MNEKKTLTVESKVVNKNIYTQSLSITIAAYFCKNNSTLKF
jgi:hypothetical protein